MSETAVKVAVHRMKQHDRRFLRDEVAQTVDKPGEIDEELRDLMQTLRG